MNNISKSDLSTKGFSALELMVSIGILGILTGITLNQFKQMKMKAYQVEAVRTTAFVDSLMKDFFSERNRFPLDSECPEGLYRGDECLLGHPDRDNSECYHENTFGSYDHGDEIFIDCERVGDRIRQRIADTDFVVQDGTTNLTASIGVAAYPEHAGNREKLLKMADDCMYFGKKNGKNKVTLLDQVIDKRGGSPREI